MLRIDADVLRPVKPGTNEPDAVAKTIDVAFPSFEITWVDGRLGFSLGGGPTLPRSMVATSGVIVSANGIRWLDPDSANKPTNTPAGFTGLFLDDVSVELGGLPINVGTVSMDDVFIGTGGFSGTVSWSDPTLRGRTRSSRGSPPASCSGSRAP